MGIRIFKHFLLLIILALSFAGCTQDPKSGDAIAQLQLNVDDATNRIEALEADLASAKNTINRLNISRLAERQRERAILDPAEPSFQRVDSNLGTFAVSIGNIRGFADGVKATLNLGNLSSATFNGVTLNLKYGSRAPDFELENYKELNDRWKKSLQERSVEITSSLRVGAWNPVSVTLPKIKEEAFGYLEVRIKTDQISLYR